MTRLYNDPNAAPVGSGTRNSSIGKEQFNTFKWQRKALIELKKDQFFMPMADVESMPKHYGKKIKRYHYMPMLDDANINDEGINMKGHSGANGPDLPIPGVGADAATDIRFVATIIIKPRETLNADGSDRSGYELSWMYAVGYGNDSKAATTAAQTIATGCIATLLDKPSPAYASYAAAKTAYEGASGSPTGNAVDETFTRIDASNDGAKPYGGNLYASSKDVGTIVGKLPALSEQGGRVNRVGFRRIELEGSISKFGIFDEWTKDSLDFDTDEDLEMHINREMLRGANEITEDQLQIDLLNAAGVVRYAGSATTTKNIVGMMTYNDFVELGVALDDNRTPKHVKIISGSRMIDTKVIPAARPMYVGSEMIPYLKSMKDYFGDPAFIPIEKYAAAGNVMNGEIGAIDQFRIIVVPEMMHWANAGGTAFPGGTPAGATDYALRSTDGTNADIFPMLVIGDASFTSIGFQTDGKSMKFKIITKKPGKETADWHDPFGEKGFMSIKWWYGFMALRPERIALFKTALPRSIIMKQPKVAAMP